MVDTGVKRGVKRKREHHGKTEDISARLRAKLHHCAKEVRKASKKVKVFETQKVVKKLKDARETNNEENIKLYETQLEYLKQHIDHEHIAVQALRSKINKDPFLSRNADCQAAISSELQTSKNDPVNAQPHRAVVESRLLSSKVLAQEIASVVLSLKAVLGEDNKGNAAVEGVTSENGDLEEEEEEEAGTTDAAKSVGRTKGRIANDEGDGDGEDTSGVSWTGFGDVDGDESTQETGDTESSEQDDEDDGWESGTVYSEESGIGQLSSDDSLLPQNMKKSHTKVGGAKVKTGKAGASTFLPSLSVGFINAGSDSEWSDAEADLADSSLKKNRRGQRARKAIWEKKYGKHANHLKKSREIAGDSEKPSYSSRERRNRGAERGGAIRGRGRSNANSSVHAPPTHSSGPPAGRGQGRESGPRQGYGDHQPQGDNGWKTRQDHTLVPRKSVNTDAPSHGAKEDGKPLHPSWEAKRKLKEKQSAAIVPPQGTRMTFA
ncbi:Bud-site selection protein [Phellopilus nigrolimitatus]|nr:Bud-site selection protein [Phellopilus nigrolimitatus]